MSKPSPALRTTVLAATGQDVRRCSHCDFCSATITDDADLSVQMLIQLVVLNDEEVLTSRTLWSDAVLESAGHTCTSGIDIGAVLLALREEARRRGHPGHDSGS